MLLENLILHLIGCSVCAGAIDTRALERERLLPIQLWGPQSGSLPRQASACEYWGGGTVEHDGPGNMVVSDWGVAEAARRRSTHQASLCLRMCGEATLVRSSGPVVCGSACNSISQCSNRCFRSPQAWQAADDFHKGE